MAITAPSISSAAVLSVLSNTDVSRTRFIATTTAMIQIIVRLAKAGATNLTRWANSGISRQITCPAMTGPTTCHSSRTMTAIASSSFSCESVSFRIQGTTKGEINVAIVVRLTE